MIVTSSITTLREAIAPLRDQKIVFVPTMGNLHAGHMELVKKAKQISPHVIVSIFVNPLQFGPNEDYARYPRTLEEDLQQLKEHNVSIVFTPTTETLSMDGSLHTIMTVPKYSEELCGHFRPGFFNGVTTIVAKLFNIVQPDIALFGEKDFQQLFIVRKMINDLCFPIDIVSVSTTREEDGLAMSSRNRYLTEAERATASQIYHVLSHMKTSIEQGERSYTTLAEQASTLLASNFKIDYLTIRNKITLAPATATDEELVILFAGWLGQTRLIDNVFVFPGN